MRNLLLALGALAGAWFLAPAPAAAQNPTCPTRPAGDSSNACASTAFVQGSAGGGSVVQYVPVVGDNTSALQAAANAAAAAGKILQLPCNTTIQANGPLLFGSNTWLRGCGPYSTILQKTPNSGATTFITNTATLPGSPNVNMTFEQMAVDGQAVTQSPSCNPYPSCANFYNFVMQFVNNLRLDYFRSFNSAGTTILIYENDTHGGGPGGKPTQPNGQQYNANIFVSNSEFDCTGATNPGADCADFLRTSRMVFGPHNWVHGGQANCYGEEFNTDVTIYANYFTQCWRAIYSETSYHRSVTDNDIVGGGSSANGDVPQIGIWVADANQTYVTGGYNGGFSQVIKGNHIHDMQRVSGTTGEIGVLVTGPQITGTITAGAVDIDVSLNTFYNMSGGGGGIGISFQGNQTRPIAIGNSCNLVSVLCVQNTAPYTAPGYASAQSNLLARISSNTSQQGPSVTGSTGFGTGPTVTMASGSTDDSFQINITTGTAPSNQGTVSVQLSTNIAQNVLRCVSNAGNQGGGWTAPGMIVITPVIGTVYATVVLGWFNGATNLTASTTYSIQGSCGGS